MRRRGGQANASPDRLTRPLVRRGGELVETSWDEAMDAVVGRTRELLDEQGPSAVGFYTTGQLFLEEYYTLGLVAHGGIGTNHVDGNTRLCTATAAEALEESFASDGQPGSYTDIDHADVDAPYGHKMVACRVSKVEASGGTPSPAPTTTASAPLTGNVPPTRGGAGSDVDEELVTTGGAR